MTLPSGTIGCASNAIAGVARVHRDEAVALRRRHEEVRVVHPQRFGDPRPNEFLE
jgi:hypothetical protein